VTTPLVVAITAVAVLLAVLGIASTLARRRIGLLHLVVAGVLEALLVVQAVLAIAAMAGGQTPPETATFAGYLAGVVLVPVAGALWARTEQTRYAGTVIAVAAAVVGVMVWRLLQLWEAIPS
jgi:4-amino-4-deoxy-L-arabinose transferase-like glycosyltransferase